MTHRPTVYGTRHAVSAGHYLAAVGRLLHPGSRRQRDRRRLRRRHRAWRAAARPGERRRRGTDHDPAGERHTSRASPASAGGRRRCPPTSSCASTAARSPTACCAPSSPPRPTPGSPRWNATARCASPMSRRYCDPLRRRGLRGLSAARHLDRLARARVPALAVQHRDLPAQRPRAEVGREIRAVRPGAHAAIHGRPGPRRRSRPRGGAARGARCVLSRRHRARDRPRSSSRRAAICRWTTSPSTARAIEPVVRRPWRGHEVITCGPWCQGPALHEALALLERVGIAGLAHNSATYLHRIAECVNLAMADREYHLRRSGLRRCADRSPARSGDDRPARLGGARRPRVRRDAGAARSHQPAARGQHGRAAEGRGGHVVLLRRRSLGQRVQRHAVGRLGQCAGRAGAGHHAVGARFAEPARSAPSGRRRTRQAAAADAQSGDGGDRGRRRDAVRHAGRRRADPGDAAGAAQHLPARHGGAGRDRGAARRVAIRSRRRSRRSSISRGGWRWKVGSIRRCAPISRRAGTRCRRGRTGPGWPARWRRCCAIR